MASRSEKVQATVDFLTRSFSHAELVAFLNLNEYEEVAAAVTENVSLTEYAPKVVEALDRRRLVARAFSQRLLQERSGGRAEVEALRVAWLEDAPSPPEPTGGTTLPGAETTPPRPPAIRTVAGSRSSTTSGAPEGLSQVPPP